VAALLSRTDYAPFELLLAGARLGDAMPLPPELGRDPRVRRLEVRAESEAGAIAASLPHARGDIVGLLGFVEPIAGDWLAEMASHALRPEIGAVGARLYDEAGAIAHAGIVLGAGGLAGRLYRGVPKEQACRVSRLWMIQGYSAVSGACLVVRRELLERIGGIDAANLPSVYFDVDLCLRLRAAGYRTLWTPYAELTWLGADGPDAPAAEAAGRASAGEEKYMKLRWGSLLERDPNYNANLSLEREDGSLAAQPRRLVPWADAGPAKVLRAEVQVSTSQHSPF
jgi:hypothetical protein